MPEEVPSLEDVVTTLVENGAVYVAVNKQSVTEEPVQIYYHLPVGVSNEQKETIATYLTEVVGHRLEERQPGAVTIDGQTIPAVATSVLHDDVHLYRRIPAYVGKGVSGLDPVEIEDGVGKIRDVKKSDPEIPPRPAETVPLERLVARLAEGGAASVEMADEFLVREEPLVELRIPMVPAEGKPMVGPVDSVEVADDTYPLNTTLTLDGIYGSAPGWTALYVTDDVDGTDPVPVEDGMQRARERLELAADVNTLQELERRLKSDTRNRN